MLLELRVENYAVIDNVAVEFAAGLNLLTGETGAGKSILIDALALLLGEKASADVIRHGAEKAVVAGVFEAPAKLVDPVLEANGLDSDSAQLILRREISAGGKGRVFVNNQPATVAVLKQLAPLLGAIHAQSESILSFDAHERLVLLDRYADLETAAIADAFSRWNGIRQRIADLQRDEQDRLRLVDLWSFQKKEVEQARLAPGEDERLENEKRVLSNAEKLHQAASAAYDNLYDSNGSATATMRAAGKSLEELARYDSKFAEAAATLAGARAVVEDLGLTLRDYAANINASPERLAEIEDRLAALDRLKRKYGATVADVLAFGAGVAQKLNEIENKDEVLRELNKDLATAADAYLKRARGLSKERYDTAKRLERLVEDEINDLAMKARFKIEVTGADDQGNWTSFGFDHVQYMIATNAGEPLHPVDQIASGGELSRVLLALKATVLSSAGVPPAVARTSRPRQNTRTLVFDEIDTGIGGRAAEAVGKKLKSLARSEQVLCITHLPQIASFADQHYAIEKKEAQGRTRTSVRRLDAKERTEEIARMLSGAKLTDTSLKHAEQMLKANA
ncbi:MAG: DNA repair protein RecN [Candidatus Koribacter versatilis]|uniref:DNA repair protein RecN n=1 Tax=Candidatus Korobacter versatilis TaxID=658062 RepID=A0A932A9T6_9BACT|nr:DNA repair protein RecN [Candidatus Koribacter versatilis]